MGTTDSMRFKVPVGVLSDSKFGISKPEFIKISYTGDLVSVISTNIITVFQFDFQNRSGRFIWIRYAHTYYYISTPILCDTKDWGYSFDVAGWCECDKAFMMGIRNGGVTYIYEIEEVDCFNLDFYSDSYTTIEANWGYSFDNEGWVYCSDVSLTTAGVQLYSFFNNLYFFDHYFIQGRFLYGLERSGNMDPIETRDNDNILGKIEQARCAKHTDFPDEYFSCYDQEVNFNVYGWKYCGNENYITGFHRGVSDYLNSLDYFRCCTPQLPDHVSIDYSLGVDGMSIEGLYACPENYPFLDGIFFKKDTDGIEAISSFECEEEKLKNGTNHFYWSDWVLGSPGWALCPDGYVVNGLYRTGNVGDCDTLSCLSQSRCIKPAVSLSGYGDCYDRSFDSSSNVYFREGWVRCLQKGYHIVGVYETALSDFRDITLIRCCSLNYTVVVCEDGLNSTDPNSCSGERGLCRGTDYCECFGNYTGEVCEIHSCFGVFSNDSSVCSSNSQFCPEKCSNHGLCIDDDLCECDDGYNGTHCSDFYCFDIFYNHTDKVCGGDKGSCSSPNNCSCIEDRYKMYVPDCSVWECHGLLNNDTESYNPVCSGKGICEKFNSCVCEEGYQSEDCSVWECSGYGRDDKNSCNGFGTCIGLQSCHCEPNYYFQKNSTVNITYSTECLRCPIGTEYYDNNEKWNVETKNNSYCIPCQNGSISNDDTDGYCVKCPIGTYANENHTICIDCPPGKFGMKVGGKTAEEACQDCPAGFIGLSYGLKNKFGCTPCPVGHYQPFKGKKSVDEDCIPCSGNEECPLGSVESFPLNRDLLEGNVEYNDKILNFEAGGVSYLFKLVVLWCVVFVCIILLCVIGQCACSNEIFDTCLKPPETSTQTTVPSHLSQRTVVDTSSRFDDEEEEELIDQEKLYEEKCYTDNSSTESTDDSDQSNDDEQTDTTVTHEEEEEGGEIITEDEPPPPQSSSERVVMTKVAVRNPKTPCLETKVMKIFCCCWIRDIRFTNFDFFYNLAHDVPEGKGPIRKKTSLGGFFSIIALCLAILFLIWSITDFVTGSKLISQSADFYLATEDNQVKGDLLFTVDFFGDFENCSATVEHSGIDVPESHFLCETKYTVTAPRAKLGCVCWFDCHDCTVEASDELYVRFLFQHEDQYVRYIRYYVALPSFRYDGEGEKYEVDGKYYENNGTLVSSSIDLSIFRRHYTAQNTWNLLLGLLDLEEMGITEYEGLGCGILSFSKDSVYSLDDEKNSDGISMFTFDMKLSGFEQFINEYFPQTLLNFTAQMFALIGLSVSLVGFLFGKSEKFCESFASYKRSVLCRIFCCCLLWNDKIQPVGNDERNHMFVEELVRKEIGSAVNRMEIQMIERMEQLLGEKMGEEGWDKIRLNSDDFMKHEDD